MAEGGRFFVLWLASGAFCGRSGGVSIFPPLAALGAFLGPPHQRGGRPEPLLGGSSRIRDPLYGASAGYPRRPPLKDEAHDRTAWAAMLSAAGPEPVADAG